MLNVFVQDARKGSILVIQTFRKGKRMGMTIDDCIHKLDFSIGAYQKLIDENVSNGEVVGTGVRGTWTASTSLNRAYSDMIEALQIAKDIIRKYQKTEQIIKDHDNDRMPEDYWYIDKIKEVIGYGNDN